MGTLMGNGRGSAAMSIAMAVALLGSLLIGSLLVLSGIQRRASLAGAAGMVSKDASVGGVEIMNQLIASGVIKAYDAQFPPVDADCVTKKSCNTTYLRAVGVSFGVGNPPIGMNWNFVEGFVQSSKAPDKNLANIIYRVCNPLTLDPTIKRNIEIEMKAVFQKNPVLPPACATIDTKVIVSDAKSGVFMELEARAP